MKRGTGVTVRLLAVLVLAAGCAPKGIPASLGRSEAGAYSETFEGSAEGFTESEDGGLTTTVEGGAYVVTLEDDGTAHRTAMPVSQTADGMIRIEAEIEVDEGPIYGLGCWTAEDRSGYLGVVQVTNGEAAGGITYETASGDLEPLERADQGPTVRVAERHILRLECTRRSDRGAITLSIDDEELADVSVEQPPDAGGTSLYVHYGGTPPGSAAVIRFHEVKVNPPE